MAGQLRYLDSRPDEQEKLITMKSSAISLLYQDNRADVVPNGMAPPLSRLVLCAVFAGL